MARPGRAKQVRGGRGAPAPLRWTKRDAQSALARWRASGLSLPAWCRDQGLAYERVRRWRSQLALAPVRHRQATLLPVELVEHDRVVEGPVFALELPGGLRLQIPAAFDEAALARLLRVVETRP